jgi:hypothetical protein
MYIAEHCLASQACCWNKAFQVFMVMRLWQWPSIKANALLANCWWEDDELDLWMSLLLNAKIWIQIQVLIRTEPYHIANSIRSPDLHVLRKFDFFRRRSRSFKCFSFQWHGIDPRIRISEFQIQFKQQQIEHIARSVFLKI